MRTAITAVIATILTTFSAQAQDLLVRRDGSQVRVKVLEVSKKKVKYVRYMTESPVYTLPVADIDYIEYPNGDRDTFAPKTAKPAEKPVEVVHPAETVSEGVAEDDAPRKWRGPARPPVSYDEAQRRATENVAEASLPVYDAGDIYSHGGVTGIVVITTDGGRHGVVMSLDEACLAWCSLPRRELQTTGATDLTDGEKNMEAVGKFILENYLSWSDFPAFEWCRAKGEGWYLPSVNEVWLLGTIYNGGSRLTAKKKVRKFFNDMLRENDGKPLNNIMFYQSSTETADARYSLYSHLGLEKPYTADGNKGDKLFVRAFHKF